MMRAKVLQIMLKDSEVIEMIQLIVHTKLRLDREQTIQTNK